MKKEKKKTYLYLHAHECRLWWWQDLQGLRGEAQGWVLCGEEAGVFGPSIWGKEGLCNIG